ncbi:NlpC/P60 family protein [Oribacterium sp. WCC10]|nr:NlpC/P60 family protein [Oribacterium sp. WCC10]
MSGTYTDGNTVENTYVSYKYSGNVHHDEVSVKSICHLLISANLHIRVQCTSGHDTEWDGIYKVKFFGGYRDILNNKITLRRIAVVVAGVVLTVAMPSFADQKTRFAIDGSAQMTVREMKEAAEEKDKRASSEYTVTSDNSSEEVTETENTSEHDSEPKSNSDSNTESKSTGEHDIESKNKVKSEEQETAEKEEKTEKKDNTSTEDLSRLLNIKADVSGQNNDALRLDPEETLTYEQETEVLSTTEIERYVKANYSVLQQFTNESEYTTRARQAVISYAMQFIGNPYVWGGTSLTNGADCSGFVQEIFRHFGITTGRTSRDQYANCVYLKGKEVMPGDLIFYADNTGYINHVAIYAGNYMIIHAANRKAGIKINRYDYKQPYAYGRFIAN